MEQELESLNQQMQGEIKQIRDKYNTLKKIVELDISLKHLRKKGVLFQRL